MTEIWPVSVLAPDAISSLATAYFVHERAGRSNPPQGGEGVWDTATQLRHVLSCHGGDGANLCNSSHKDEAVCVSVDLAVGTFIRHSQLCFLLWLS